MEIIESNENIIIKPYSPILNKRESYRLFESIKNISSGKIGIDLSLVNECTNEFINVLEELAQKRNIGVFNIPSDIFTIFSFMDFDKKIQLFVSQMDFENDIRQLLIRRFSVI